MSENLDLVRSISANWERGDFSWTAWADPTIDWVMADGAAPGTWTGLGGMAEGWREFRGVWSEYHFAPQEYRELDGKRVLVLGRFTGRSKASEPTPGPTRSNAARLFHVCDGNVTRLVLYANADRALADLGLKE